MWTGYLVIQKDATFTDPDKVALLLIGSAQTPNYPNLRTHCRYSLDNKKAIVELESAIEPVEGDIPFALDAFAVEAGACWCDRCDTTCAYIAANLAEWEA